MPSQHVARTTFDVLMVTCSRRPPFQPPQGVSERGAATGPWGIVTREGPAMQRRTRALPGAFLGARGSAAEGRVLASGSWHAFSTARNRHPRSSPRDGLARPPPGPSLRPGGGHAASEPRASERVRARSAAGASLRAVQRCGCRPVPWVTHPGCASLSRRQTETSEAGSKTPGEAQARTRPGTASRSAWQWVCSHVRPITRLSSGPRAPWGEGRWPLTAWPPPPLLLFSPAPLFLICLFFLLQQFFSFISFLFSHSLFRFLSLFLFPTFYSSFLSYSIYLYFLHMYVKWGGGWYLHSRDVVDVYSFYLLLFIKPLNRPGQIL